MSRALALVVVLLFIRPVWADEIASKIQNYFEKELAVEASYDLRKVKPGAETADLGVVEITGHAICRLYLMDGYVQAECVPLNVIALKTESMPLRFIRSLNELRQYRFPEISLREEFTERLGKIVYFSIVNQAAELVRMPLFPAKATDWKTNLHRIHAPLVAIQGTAMVRLANGRSLSCEFIRQVWRLDKALIELPTACETSLYMRLFDTMIGHFPPYKGPLIKQWKERLQLEPANILELTCR